MSQIMAGIGVCTSGPKSLDSAATNGHEPTDLR